MSDIERLIANAEWWSGWCVDQGDPEHDRVAILLWDVAMFLKDVRDGGSSQV